MIADMTQGEMPRRQSIPGAGGTLSLVLAGAEMRFGRIQSIFFDPCCFVYYLLSDSHGCRSPVGGEVIPEHFLPLFDRIPIASVFRILLGHC